MTSGEVLNASGPEQIRAGFAAATTTTDLHAGELAGLAAILRDAADRYNDLQMAASTLEHVRDAATGLAAAAATVGTAGEYLRTAAHDFDARDGRVAEALAEAGNLMSAAGYTEPLTLGGPRPTSAVGTGEQSHPRTDRKALMTSEPAAFKDPLKIGGRITLRDGESFAGSATAPSDDEGNLLLAAAVETPTGRTVHVGVPINEEEEKRHWKGAHAPATESEVDEDEGYTRAVDTGADRTVILDATAAAQLPGQVEQAIERAAAADKQYRRLAALSDQLYDERARLEGERFGSTVDADQQMHLDSREHSHRKFQPQRRAYIEDAVSYLRPEDRARHDDIQRRIEAAGKDLFEPGSEQQAAEVCGLSADDFHELIELTKIPFRRRSSAERERYEQLNPDRLPPLLAEQAAIVFGLTVEQYREREKLHRLGPVRPPRLRRYGGRTPEQQLRFEELSASPGGAVGTTPEHTQKIRHQFESYLSTHHTDRIAWTTERRQQTELANRAKPLSQADTARLAEVISEHDALNAQLDELGGQTTARVEIPGQGGLSLVVEAVQREEDGGVDYSVFCQRPTTTDDEPHEDPPYRTKAAGVRKIARMISDLSSPSSRVA